MDYIKYSSLQERNKAKSDSMGEIFDFRMIMDLDT